AFQNMRYAQIISDLTEISLATVIHHAGPADDLEICDPRELGQDVVLDAIDERPAFLLVAQIFKRQNRNPSCYRMTDQFTFRNDPSSSRHQRDQARWLDYAAPISFLARKVPCAAPESVHALTNVRHLQLARERTCTGALDLSLGT